MKQRSLLRRDVVKIGTWSALGVAMAKLVPLAGVIGCDESAGTDSESGGTVGSTDDSTVAGDAWAQGGTSAMTGKLSYPNPFTDVAAACALVTTVTEGPCTTVADLLREDVSESWTGLPVRLQLKIVNAACQPLSGATVKIWHTNREGSYSGPTPNNNMCLKNQSYAAQQFFRGAQVTGVDGTVAFDTCFPGWYRGRCVHIHVQVKADGIVSKVSQVFFPEATTAAIFTSHPEYKGYGQPDTSFASDNVMAGIPAAQRAQHVLRVAKMPDGVMQASAVLAVTS